MSVLNHVVGNCDGVIQPTTRKPNMSHMSIPIYPFQIKASMKITAEMKEVDGGKGASGGGDKRNLDWVIAAQGKPSRRESR